MPDNDENELLTCESVLSWDDVCSEDDEIKISKAKEG